jgi:hypothetical protein
MEHGTKDGKRQNEKMTEMKYEIQKSKKKKKR